MFLRGIGPPFYRRYPKLTGAAAITGAVVLILGAIACALIIVGFALVGAALFITGGVALASVAIPGALIAVGLASVGVVASDTLLSPSTKVGY